MYFLVNKEVQQGGGGYDVKNLVSTGILLSGKSSNR